MNINRRRLFAAFAVSAGAATPALARDDRDTMPPGDAASFGLRPNAAEDQSAALQRAIERAAATHTVPRLPPGIYRAGALQLPPYAAIAGNTVRGAGNGGILVWRSTPGDDGTLVADNRIEDIANKSGGSGQWGNAINVFRAGNVIVRGNRIRNAA